MARVLMIVVGSDPWMVKDMGMVHVVKGNGVTGLL
jgi:hypothetical protein